ncbi:MAG TPA: nicotinate-nucleotide--dimethylbenzimidazole phosphoribosyltransferase [Kofleriaceae bacterium]|nr:nicotinate-nucleotide--dimethylbenzimidazole phosphoribosyltransferase [Kofleriaceae bacterium]
MHLLTETRARIVPIDRAIEDATQHLLDAKTKPRRSLGRLEDVACQIAAIRGTMSPTASDKAIVVMGADHGVVEAGVSAYPQEVTAQMMHNFANGGAAINVLARHAGARVIVVDMGVKEPLAPDLGIRTERIAAGTRNFAGGPAMTREQAVRAIEVGIRIAAELAAGGVTLLGIGEMGIGNTTASSAIVAALTGISPDEVTGRGTGIDDATLRRKIDVIKQALAANRPDPTDALDTLAKLGGFEIAGLCGVVLGAAAARIPVVMDGFIASTAALCATRLAAHATSYLLASHRSVEAGHRIVLGELGAKPLLDLELRLGEGTGAALAMSLVDASLRILAEMATFTSAGVSDSGS